MNVLCECCVSTHLDGKADSHALTTMMLEKRLVNTLDIVMKDMADDGKGGVGGGEMGREGRTQEWKDGRQRGEMGRKDEVY